MSLTLRVHRGFEPSSLLLFAALVSFFAPAPGPLPAQVIPHNQDRPPGPPLSAEEARRTMTVPDGFRVEIFASEPDIVNPVAMTFDERGRVWITESLEYPRRSAGPGKDRVKVLEDTDGDGKADRFTVFADGLNIPSGIAVGNGGVFVANSPDILFLKDTDGDGKADHQEVLLTGFGRYDTHELPNTLTWGPDGWLYGLNGVFNQSVVVHKGKEYRFDAALWRYHPRTRDFELFAEGTSNPWGLAFDGYGSAFVSACVIDHLFHLAENGYYHRQAGQYPPFTWKIESIVKHVHQKAAYCSLALYDADVYPETYRGRLFMGNIHGNCINVDKLSREGSTYLGSGEADFLSGNDVWFMPVSVKLAPDGCLFLLDWYDRYHCYQDANRDPAGIDRSKGRLYRIDYGNAPRAGRFDLARESDENLFALLSSPNLWRRDEAKRLLAERLSGARKSHEAVSARLRSLVLSESAPRRDRVHALWTLLSAEDPGNEPKLFDSDYHLKLLSISDSLLRAWSVRAAGNIRQVSAAVRARVRDLARDPDPDVRLQAATAARKLFDDENALPLLLDTLSASEGDALIPHIVWRNLEPLVDKAGDQLAAWFSSHSLRDVPAVRPILGRTVERLLAREDKDFERAAAILEPALVQRKEAPAAAEDCLSALGKALSSGVASGDSLSTLKRRIQKPVSEILSEGVAGPLYFSGLNVAAAWRDEKAIGEARKLLLDSREKIERRGRALEALLASRDDSILMAAAAVLKSPGSAPEPFLRDLLAGLGKLGAPEVASTVLEALSGMPASVQPQAIDLLTERPSWASALLGVVEKQQLDRSAINLNQVRRILVLEDNLLRERVTSIWGHLRAERSPEREKVIARTRKVLETHQGNPWRGKAVFEKTCLQCHTIFGRGQNVGPDITVNGRETLDALLTNLLDPNLVIGKGYQAWTLLTNSGRVLTGLLAEDSLQKVVLKVACGKEEVVPRDDVKALEVSEVSLMPEDLEKTLKEEEFSDLISYLRYDEAPPEPVETQKKASRAPPRIFVSQEYGEVIVKARFPRDAALEEPVELVRYEHSSDGRPFLHPLRAPGRGTVLTALRPEGHPFHYGVFTGHARVNESDFWHEKGWIRSRGLESVVEADDSVEILARSDWLTQKRGGERILAEKQIITVHSPDAADRYRIDFVWQLTPDAQVTFGQQDYGGLAFTPAVHADHRLEKAEGEPGRPWQDISGRFGRGAEEVLAGVAIFDHPGNPGFPGAWRVDSEGLLNPAITARGPLVLPAGKTTAFRYRLVVHLGHGEKRMLDEEFQAWAKE